MAEEPERKTVKVVVLGDIGRSPRMQYHALSLANNGLKVKIIAYVDSAPLTEILENPNITLTKLHPLVFDKGPKLVRYAAKALWQTISLLLTLLVSGNCDYLLCQNPPAIPTLPVCRFYCLVTRTKFIIDWHNYGFSLMAMSLPQDHLLLRFSQHIETYFGQSSQHNLCVTYAMREDLLQNWNIVATVLYDRPPKIFHPISLQEKHEWFLKIGQHYPELGCSGQDAPSQPEKTASLLDISQPERTTFTQPERTELLEISQLYPESGRSGQDTLQPEKTQKAFTQPKKTTFTQPERTAFTQPERTAFTQLVNGVVESLGDRPGLLFTSTSWTEDEDFGILMHALQVYEITYSLTTKLPKLICVITGKGPMKQHYIDMITAKKWQHVTIITPWLEAPDYPTMVASADLGVCLHTSSSGLDLPMKVVDMFGAGLPVCAFDFLCLDELVENGLNGYTFKSSDELSKQIVTWFEDFPNNENQNRIAEGMRRELTKFQDLRWEDNWNKRARKFFES